MVLGNAVSADNLTASCFSVASNALDPVTIIGFGSVASLHMICALAGAAASRPAPAARPPATRRIRRFIRFSMNVSSCVCANSRIREPATRSTAMRELRRSVAAVWRVRHSCDDFVTRATRRGSFAESAATVLPAGALVAGRARDATRGNRLAGDRFERAMARRGRRKGLSVPPSAERLTFIAHCGMRPAPVSTSK